jgi:GT2 family glycosyltransferase
VVYFPEALVTHYKGRSTRKVSGFMTREFYRSMALFYRKYYAVRAPVFLNAAVYGAIWLLGHLALLKHAITPVSRRTVGSAD